MVLLIGLPLSGGNRFGRLVFNVVVFMVVVVIGCGGGKGGGGSGRLSLMKNLCLHFCFDKKQKINFGYFFVF